MNNMIYLYGNYCNESLLTRLLKINIVSVLSLFDTNFSIFLGALMLEINWSYYERVDNFLQDLN